MGEEMIDIASTRAWLHGLGMSMAAWWNHHHASGRIHSGKT